MTQFGGRTRRDVVRELFVQPGMRYCQAQVLVKSLMEDEYFAVQSPAVRKLVKDRILEDVKGRMLEDLVILETIKSCRGRKNVQKAMFVSGDIDMVVSDPETLECSIYEVKHSSERHTMQTRHILDPEKRKRIESWFGTIRRTEVLYRGKPGTFSIVAELGMTEASIPYPQRLAARALANGAAVTTPRGETPRVR